MRPRRPRGGSDRGAATLLAAVLVASLALAATAGAAVGSVALRRAQVQSVADVAALAAAQAAPDSCAVAAAAVGANGMVLVSCDLDGDDVRVQVAGAPSPALARVIGLLGRPEPTVMASARAGPPSG